MGWNIYLTGFSGSGKTTIGRQVAAMTGWTYRDTDDEIVAGTGRAIEEIFREDGEAAFRKLERGVLESVSQGERQVVSTGGGIVVDEGNHRTMEATGIIVCLEARADTIYRRLSGPDETHDEQVVRPLLQDSDPLRRIISLKSERQPLYSLAHWTVHTDDLSVTEAASEVIRAREIYSNRAISVPSQDADLAATVRTSSGDYPVWVGWGLSNTVGKRIKSLIDPGAAYVITDNLVHRHARTVQMSMEAAGIPSHIFVMESGERHKSLDTLTHIYSWLAERKAERGHLIVAVGGGVVGDVAGYAAATYLRGMPVVQAPTTLVAMMDAAVGGKTAVDLPQGKNLVGAFKQPEFVLADVEALSTLPERALVSGWAEAIKHALILDEPLLRVFEENVDSIRSLEPETASDALRRSVAIKADVVSRDERETLGVRALLNYGHTTAHALEAVTGYERYLHGEAVSIGMLAAALISNRMGMLKDSEVDRQRSVLEAYGLPLKYRDVDPVSIKDAMSMDKKTVGGRIRWVLLDGVGNAVTRSDVPPEYIDQALREVSE
ncbi:MAG: 3-dehydroquinate synthase [Chloroflexi bacterium]|nr:3-dehydroquinate synthase [Chloroflexota bacterium]